MKLTEVTSWLKWNSVNVSTAAAALGACAEVKGFDVLAYVNRGFVTRMRAPFGKSLVDTTCDGCGECVKVCPTAAVMMKKEAQPV